jgi:hypothetical protein
MKAIIVLAVINFITLNVLAQCKPADCVIPISEGCKDYCKQRYILNNSTEKELHDRCYTKKNIDKIYEYREKPEREKEGKTIDAVIGRAERERAEREYHDIWQRDKPERQTHDPK